MGVFTANAGVPVEELCGTYNVDKLSGYEAYWYSLNTTWTAFDYSDWSCELTQIEGDNVALSNLLYADEVIEGTYYPDENVIAFPGQEVTIGAYTYIFSAEKWEDDKLVPDHDNLVLAQVGEDGTISIDGFTYLSDYGNGSYWAYFCSVESTISKKNWSISVEDLCGNYNVDNLSGYEAYWFSQNTSWTSFAYSDFTCELTQVEGNTVALTNLLYGTETIVGEYLPEKHVIVFSPQTITIGDYSYIFSAENWVDNNLVPDTENAVIAYVHEDGTINMNGFTLLSDYGNGTYWGYFCALESQISPVLEAPTFEDVCGVYNVVKFEGYESKWWSQSTGWNWFSYNDYTVTIEAVDAEDGVLKLSGLLGGDDVFIGQFDFDTPYIYFDCQDVTINGSNYVFALEEWNEDGYAVINEILTVVATYKKGKIYFNDWTIISEGATIEDNWAHFSCVETTLEKTPESGIAPVVVPAQDGPAVYYNINGVRVNGDNLVPGIYIVKEGSSVRKILVK